MNKNGVIAVVVVVISIVLVGLWAMRSGERGPMGADCSAPPNTPTGVAVAAEGTKGRVMWAAPPPDESITTYIIEAGSTPGSNNQGTFVAPGTATSFDREAGAGTYYVRVFARNACGTSLASQEQTLTIQ
ncbi:MAG TPA: fibronectin type III domain-containing protein [Vicinamibacterales bacterium]|nr:fibronectin type III domain-containing protein [Vicinamibacterales bacterium]